MAASTIGYLSLGSTETPIGADGDGVAQPAVPSGSLSRPYYLRRIWCSDYQTGSDSAQTSLFGVYVVGGTAATATLHGSGTGLGLQIQTTAIGVRAWQDHTSGWSALPLLLPISASYMMAIIRFDKGAGTHRFGYTPGAGTQYYGNPPTDAFPATLTGWASYNATEGFFSEIYTAGHFRFYPNAASGAAQHTAVGGSSALINVSTSPYAANAPAIISRYNRNLSGGVGQSSIMQDLFNVDTATIPTGYRITQVNVRLRAFHVSSGFVSATIAPVIKIGATTYVGAAQGITAALAEYNSGSAWNETTPVSWTQANLDALVIGYQTNGLDDAVGTVDIRVEHCSVEVICSEIESVSSFVMTMALTAASVVRENVALVSAKVRCDTIVKRKLLSDIVIKAAAVDQSTTIKKTVTGIGG